MGGKATIWVRSILAIVFALALFPCAEVAPVSADPSKMSWSVVDTPAPGKEDNVVVPGAEVNAMAVGADGRTFYVVDTPNKVLYKSEDSGVTWKREVTDRLFKAAGGEVHIWNAVMAPDDVDIVAAVTDAVTPGPRRVFVSKDGGQNWDALDSGLVLADNEFIGCLDISVKYGEHRDIVIGTRNGDGGGKVWVLKMGAVASAWMNQNLTGSGAGDVVAVRFSPSYTLDWGIIAVAARITGTYINLGARDTVAQTTTWNRAAGYTGYPVLLRRAGETQYPKLADVITADLELPSDFLAATVTGDSPRRRYYIGINAANNVGYVYRVTNTSVSNITPPASPPGKGVFGIAYYGDYRDGELLVGEVVPYIPGRVRIWWTSDPTYYSPRWRPSQPDYGSPTGGFGTGYANAIVEWHPDGTRAYCGTSSAQLSLGGTDVAHPNRWPGAMLTPAPPGDESAFSVSPCSEWYEMQVRMTDKRITMMVGEHWTQLSLIDSNMQKLCDVAALNVPEPKPGEEAVIDYEILYLASQSGNSSYSIWRSTGPPLGWRWERVMWLPSHNADKGILLRVRQPHYEDKVRSQVVIYGEVGWRDVGYSDDEGQTWTVIPGDSDVDIVDLAVARDRTLYVLSSTAVYQYDRAGTDRQTVKKAYTDFTRNHTIAVPLYRLEEREPKEDWVIVGEAGPPDGYGRMAYVDFARAVVKFQPALEERKPVPVEGNVHVVTDDRFEGNRTIYAASHDSSNTAGKIYRWVMEKSKDWEELGPPNSAFHGLVMRNNVLYGTWAKDELIDIPGDYQGGADRTLFARAPVPPPPEWDYLIEGLPGTGMVTFTCEPSSLKISSNKYNWLWAIDNRDYNWGAQRGCLWVYIDIFAKVGPWTILPASGDVLPCDPVRGLAREINFRWRQLDYASVYEMQIAKDREFTTRVLSENVTPVDQTSPAAYYPAGGLIAVPASEIALPGTLECGHEYYWRVRARRATTGEMVRSPWSATMYFTTKVGVPVHSRYLGPVLRSPASGAENVVLSPAFSWAPLPEVTKYEFILARDPELKRVLVKKKVADTAFKYDGELSPGTTYFWQVRGVEPFITEPSAVASFIVAKAEVGPMPKPREPVGVLTWAGIAVYTILAAVVMVFIRARFGQRKDEQDVEERVPEIK